MWLLDMAIPEIILNVIVVLVVCGPSFYFDSSPHSHLFQIAIGTTTALKGQYFNCIACIRILLCICIHKL